MKKLTASLVLTLTIGLIPEATAADISSEKMMSPRSSATAKAETETTIVGALIERSDGSGGFINLKVEGGNFVITFLNRDKREIGVNLSRAIIRYRRHLKNYQFILTRSADGQSLRSSLPVDRPYFFAALPISLFKDNDASPAETYTVRLDQRLAGEKEDLPEE